VSDISSGIGTLLLGFVAVAVVLAVVDPQLIPLATNVFVFLFIDHIEGLVAGAIVGAILGSRAEGEVEVFGFTISLGAIAGAILQFLLFH
jgi:hypothetical protein